MTYIVAPLHHSFEPEVTQVEVATFLQIPGFQIVGLAAREVDEAKERIRAAASACGLEIPRRRVVLNLAPAHLPKRGTALDLPMALAVLSEDRPGIDAGPVAASGELGLDGSIRAVGRLARTFEAAWSAGARRLILSAGERPHLEEVGRWFKDLGERRGRAPRLWFAETLSEAVAALSRPWEEGMDLLEVASGRGAEILSPRTLRLSPSLSRLLGAAAAGSHHLLLLGPRGTGKTSATETLAGIWPQPPPEQQLRNRLLAELQDPYPELAATGSGPVRRVGSHASVASLIGNRSPEGWTPGEFSLAHAGLLLADELPEWHRDAREALREPLQTGRITPTRVGQRRSLPAAFALVATGNLCPCGAWPCTVGKNACRCAETERRRYRLKLSGPLLDRLDLVRVLCGEDAAGAPEIAPLTGLRAQVDRTRERLVGGYGELPGVWSDERYFRELASHPTWSGWLADTQPATLRSASKTARVAVTLAAWDGLDAPGAGHFMEAACQRPERVLADF